MIAVTREKRKTRLINPQPGVKPVPAKKRTAKPAARRRKNPVAELVTLGAINPEKRATPMKKAKKRPAAKKPAAKAPRAKNPSVRYVPVAVKSAARPKKRKKNPNQFSTAARTMLERGSVAMLGLVAARQLPQAFFGAANTGWKGYLLNAGVGIIGYIGGRYAGKPQMGEDFAIGSGAYLVNRVLTEKVSPVGRALALSGVGDATAATPAGLGRVRRGYYPIPVDKDRNGNVIVPQTIVDAVKAQLPAPAQAAAASKVSGVSRRMAAAL